MADTVTKVWIDEEECISCEACIPIAPDVLEMGDDTAKVKKEAQNPDSLKQHSEAIIEAAESCPVEAIKYETA